MAKNTFKRKELKYLLTQEQTQIIKDELEKRLVLDSYCQDDGSYSVYNLYFDTEHDEIINKSLAKPYYKEKLRMRSYGAITSDDDIVFLELKKKIDGVVNKRRATLTYNQAKNFLQNKAIPDNLSYINKQVLKEIIVFLNNNQASEKVFLSYERMTYLEDNSNLRITLDKNIRTRRSDIKLQSNDIESELLKDNNHIMEIKCDDSMPLWLTSLLSNLKAYTCGFSKYGNEYKQYKTLMV